MHLQGAEKNPCGDLGPWNKEHIRDSSPTGLAAGEERDQEPGDLGTQTCCVIPNKSLA